VCLAVASAFLLGTAQAQPLRLEVEKAEAAFDQATGTPIVTVWISKASTKAFGALTAGNIGRPMEIRIDGKAVMKPVIREPILGNSFQVSGRLTVDDVRRIAAQLSTGASRIEVEIVSE
jgi:preprotein translocase subunit SecD